MSPTRLPSDYLQLLAEVKGRIQAAQTRAVLAVNAEMVGLYWQVGQMLHTRQGEEGWGAAVIPRLALDIANALPEVKGFSERNLKRMLAFYRAYADDPAFVPQAVAQIGSAAARPERAATAPAGEVPQAVAPAQAGPGAPMLALPWGHHVLLLERVKPANERRWYMAQAVTQGWSRSVLQAQIAGTAHLRQGSLVNNFAARLNALVHRPYTQRGDIFLNLYPDRLEVVNPGRLPLGVTPQNILHASRRRNERLATLFHDVRLMEKEGSGFDLMYDIQLSQGRSVPVPSEGADSVCVSVGRRVLRVELVKLMADADARFQLRPRERICLGLLAASEGLTARELATRLELAHAEELQSAWLGRLLSLGLVQSTGKTQATRYFVAPSLLKGSGLDGKTTLKRMEPHRLRALIVEDLARYPDSSSGDINRRVGPEVPYRSLKRALDELAECGQIQYAGQMRGRRYRLKQD